jgi:hypothetical protein
MQDTLDPDEHLVEVPLVAWSGSAAAETAGKALAKFPAPSPYRLVGEGNASLGQDQLYVTKAEAEHVIQPYCVADDLGGKAMSVMWVRAWLHAASLARLGSGCQVPA